MAVLLDDTFVAGIGGAWTETDTGGHAALAPGGGVLFDGGLGSPAWGNPGIRTTNALARSNLGAYAALVRLTNSGGSGPRVRLSPSATDADAAGAVGFQVEYPDLFVTGVDEPMNGSRNGSIDYLLVTVPRPQGGYFLYASGGEYGTFPTATLLGTTATGNDASLYAHMAGHSSRFTWRGVRVVDRVSLPAALVTRFGPAVMADAFDRSTLGTTASVGGQTYVSSGAPTIAGNQLSLPDTSTLRWNMGARSHRWIEATVTIPAGNTGGFEVFFRLNGTTVDTGYSAFWDGTVCGVYDYGTSTLVNQTGATSFPSGTHRVRIYDAGATCRIFLDDVDILGPIAIPSYSGNFGIGIRNYTSQTIAVDELAVWGATTTLTTELVPGGVAPYVPAAAGAAVTTDAFTAADGTALTAYNAAWAVRSGTWEINTNRARLSAAAVADGVATRATGAAGADHELRADITFSAGAVPTYPVDPAPALFLRYTDHANQLMCRFLFQGNGTDTSPEVEIWSHINNVSEGGSGPIAYTNLGTNALLPGSTHSLRCAVNGHQVAAWFDGVLVAQGYTELLTGSNAGIGVLETNATGRPSWDNVQIYAVPGPVVDDGPPEVLSGPSVSPPPQLADTSATVVWTTAIPTWGQVEWATVDPATTGGDYPNVTALTQTPAALTTSHSVTFPLTTGQTHWWRAITLSPNGFETVSPGPVPINTVAASGAPSNLVALAVSSSQITLTWNDNSTDEVGFEVEVSTNGGATWTLLATTAANVTTYQHLGLAPQTTRHYRVRSFRTV